MINTMLRDLIGIIGAGPIGIELAVRLKQRGIPYIHFDAKQIGYTISWFPPSTHFFSSNERIAIAGVPLHTTTQSKATREEYLNYLRTVVELYDLKINTYEPLVGISREGGEFVLTSQTLSRERRLHRVSKLILCTGGTDRPRRLNIPGEDLPHVSPYFGDPHTYFRRELLIVGGKNSAVETALRCHHAGAKVSISYRREQLPERSIKYWLMPEMNSLLRSGRIASYFQTSPIEITPSHVILARGDERIKVPADFVLSLIGYEQDNTLFKLAGLELDRECGAPIYNEQTMETSVRNLYVAGTAVGGTQEKYNVFIENCHVHIERIVNALIGDAPPTAPRALEQPES